MIPLVFQFTASGAPMGRVDLFTTYLGLKPQAILRSPSGAMAKDYPVRDKGV